MAERGVWPADTARLAAGADIIALTCHQDAHNRGMVGREFLSHCKQGVRIVNVARGEHIRGRGGVLRGRMAGCRCYGHCEGCHVGRCERRG